MLKLSFAYPALNECAAIAGKQTRTILAGKKLMHLLLLLLLTIVVEIVMWQKSMSVFVIFFCAYVLLLKSSIRTLGYLTELRQPKLALIWTARLLRLSDGRRHVDPSIPLVHACPRLVADDTGSWSNSRTQMTASPLTLMRHWACVTNTNGGIITLEKVRRYSGLYFALRLICYFASL